MKQDRSNDDPVMQVASARIVSGRNLVSGGILLLENLVRLGAVALVSFWVARELGPAQFGILNFASAVVMVFLSIATLGLDTPVVLRLTRGTEPGVVLGSALVLRTAAGGLCAVGVWAAVSLMRPGEDLSIMVAAIAALSIPLSAPTLIDTWFKARNEALRPALARTAATLLACAGKAACLLLGLGVVALAWTITLEALLTSAALILVYLGASARGVPRQSLVARREEVLSLLKGSVPYAISIAAIAAYMKVDIILLGMLSSNLETGIYSLCQKLSEVLYILPVLAVEVLYPQLARHHDAPDARTLAAGQAFFDITLAVALLGTLLAIVVAAWLVPLLFGEPYRRTVELFQVHAWSCIGIAMAHARYKWMAAAGLQSLAPAVTLLGLALAVVLNLALIPGFGAAGAAAATVVAYLSSGYAASFCFRQLRPAAMMQTKALWPWGRLVKEWRSR